jgi:electron transfer flavoprotein alpha subunit
MSDLLVIVETKSGKIKGTSAELLSEGAKLATAMGGKLKALLIGDGVTQLAAETGGWGAVEALVEDHSEFKNYNAERYTTAVVDAVKMSAAAAVLASASSMGRDYMPRVAARLGTGMISEVTHLAVKDGKVCGTRPIYAGKAFVDVTVTSGGPQLVTCRPNVFETAKPDETKKANVVPVGGEAASMPVKAKIVEVVAAKSDKPDLTEASIIVSGGRSLKSGDNFKILQELADVLGAAVGASRAAVDAGYVPHSMQVGQTGKTVNPTLYIAAGISGAIQHLAGMRTSKVIVAINSDPEAPIFQIANYGIVGDLFQVLPAMTEEFKKLLKE